jgi:ferric-dicitrate binding protein FerR (iron transport regulator)
VGTEKRERQKANRALKHQQEAQAAARRGLLRKIAIAVAAVAGIVVIVWIASNVVGGDDDNEPVVTVPEVVPATDAPASTTGDSAVDATVTTTGG